MALYRERWWQYAEPRRKLTVQLRRDSQCFVAAATTKYLNFSAAPTNYVFLNTLYVFTTDRWDLYAVVQSTLHEVWARKYSGALETRLRYSPSDCFETFPFPQGLWQTPNPALADLGAAYHEHRRALMLDLWLGLTDIYNLFHARDLTPARVAKVSKKSLEEAETGYQGILELRRLHRQLDIAIRDAYGWTDLDLGHNFHEVEALAENDRVRYTISPAARKEVLKRLLAENQRCAAIETSAATLQVAAKKSQRRKTGTIVTQHDFFDPAPVNLAKSAPLAKPDQIALSRIADRAWERPGTDQTNEETVILAAILKALSAPAPRREIRLAALLAMRPRLLIPSLSVSEVVQWQRLIGAEAKPLASGVTALQPPADHAWGHAVRRFLALERMIEEPSAETWAPGKGLDAYHTEGWPEGRVGMILRVLRQRGPAIVAETLPEGLREWVNVVAA